MFLKRYFVDGLAHASYLIGAAGEAAVVDPKRDVDDYLADAERAGLKITAILNMHPHADFASGFAELALRTGAKVYTSHRAPVKYDCVSARDGERIRVGSLEIEMLETPGHSPDSLSFLVREKGQPTVIFTGGLLFVNDVGRPDLRDADAARWRTTDRNFDPSPPRMQAIFVTFPRPFRLFVMFFFIFGNPHPAQKFEPMLTVKVVKPF